jgi:hypothetical protein
MLQRGWLIGLMVLLTTVGVLAQDVGADDVFQGWLDDETVVFTSTRDGTNDLYSLKRDGSDLQQLTTGKTINGALVSPDGEQVALMLDGGFEVLALADGTTTPLLQGATNFSTILGWSADSQRILYTTTEADGGGDVLLVGIDGGEPVNLTLGMMTDASGGVVPDGKHFYVYGTYTALNQVVLFLYNQDGTPVGGQFNILSQLTFTGYPFDLRTVWSADAASVVVSFALDSAIYRVETNYGEYEMLVDTGNYVTGMAVTEDGSTLFYRTSGTADPEDDDTYRLDLTTAGAAPERLDNFPTVESVYLNVTGDRLLVLETFHQGEPAYLSFYSLADGTLVPGALEYIVVYGAGLSPDGTTAAVSVCTADDPDVDIFVLDTATGAAQNLTPDDAVTGEVPESFCAPWQTN